MVNQTISFVVLILGIVTQCAFSFITPHHGKSSFIMLPSPSPSRDVRCFMTNDNNDAPKRIRRKRKEGKTVQDVTNTNANLEPSIPIEAVEMEVMDIRDLVSGGTSTGSSTTTYDDTNVAISTGSTSFSTTTTTTTTTTSSSSSNDDSLERLLADAKKMRLESSTNDDDNDGGISAPDAIKNVISTIVTIDFFVVCGLLLWFLAGIFCSYVIKDDAVQIAFNMIFQPVVQPALGILMIGSAAGAAFQDGNE